MVLGVLLIAAAPATDRFTQWLLRHDTQLVALEGTVDALAATNTPSNAPLFATATALARFPTPTPEIFVEIYEVIAINGLNVRDEPNTESAVVGALELGQQIILRCDGLEVVDGYRWCEITEGQYGGRFVALQRLGDGVFYLDRSR